jgi:hypothetical protein
MPGNDRARSIFQSDIRLIVKQPNQRQQVLEGPAKTKPEAAVEPRAIDTNSIDGSDPMVRRPVVGPSDLERPQIRYIPQKRKANHPNQDAAFFGRSSPPKRTAGAQELKTPLRKSSVHVANKPPRFPPGAWPLEMRADTVAALLDFSSTRELCKAIQRGEAPRPNATRGSGSTIEVVWFVRAVEDFVARRNLVRSG